ncbi:dephospho-CoA kinase [uncultured Serinicoccus sp.]|uniref:dephospho-CoA kinase n=1 Tax=uncultured Serinicoccus sp. TaxID=735514 RepID=UPI0026018556|nr:dephospho-CoA kinase [uncultured Serinicoccus sp.]
MTLRVGLSGGIGSGKSTVSAQLASLGAVVVDADAVAREVVGPGTPGLAQIAGRFGPDVIAADGSLDRPALGQVVFGDAQARRDLEAITHPLIRRRSQQLFEAAPDDAVVVHDVPLLVELGMGADYALTVIADVPEEERLRRLVELRGMDEQAARSRIRAQADDGQRRAAADVLLDNSGTLDDLRRRVDDLWSARIVPFREHLADGIPGSAPGAGSSGEDERLRARVEAALGRPLGEGVDLGALDEPAVRHGLRRRGLLMLTGDGQAAADGRASGASDEVVIASADPASAARLRLGMD